MENVEVHEQELTRYCLERMHEIEGIHIFGPQTLNYELGTRNQEPRALNQAPHRDAVVSFLVGDIHHLDMGTLLDRLGIAVRTGHHCAHPLMTRLGVTGTVRASFALYNTKEEIDTLVAGIQRVSKMF
jgi:cysteine desulfurase/selenocysteine lyase